MTAPYAADPDQSRGRLHDEAESRTRSPFQRDRDRIIHSGAFRKLKYKTQVFVYHEGDYYRTRLTHSIEVAQIARSIARSLALNEDLAEAVALAHDLGHTPFGHAGEDALDAQMQGFGGFRHNDQTVRILTKLEQRYAEFDGLNLTWEALEGVVKHNGPVRGEALTPSIAAANAARDLALDGWPSAEAQVAALSDDIAYNNHDIDDGLRAGLFSIDELIELPLVGPLFQEVARRYPGIERRRWIHEVIRRMINAMVDDLLSESTKRLEQVRPRHADDLRAADGPVIAFSDDMVAIDQALRDFLMRRMYRHYQVNRETAKAKRVVAELFQAFTARPSTLPTEWQADLGDDATRNARRVADYIAGMTDRYALVEHERLFELRGRY